MVDQVLKKESSAEFNFETTADSRKLNLVLDTSKIPPELAKISSAYENGRSDEMKRLLLDFQDELESYIDQFPPDIVLYVAHLFYITYDYEKADRWYEKVASTNPEEYRFWGCMATYYMQSGRIQKGLEIFRKTVDRIDDKIDLMSIYLFNSHYDHTSSRKSLFQKHKEWGRLVSEKIVPGKIDFEIKSSGKIRIGYVSPDFKKHSVAYFAKPLIANHDRDKFEIYVYSNVAKSDSITEMFFNIADVGRDIYNMNDKEVSDMISNDKIDILVDLAGHSDGNRLKVFAEKPAPIQVTYLGYPDTTGLETMDYRFTDSIADTKDSAEYHSETPFFLPGSFLCYEPLKELPGVKELAFRKNGHITFGSFNNIRKLNPYIISLWSRVLLSVEGSRMIIKIKGGDNIVVKDNYHRIFEENGVSADRIDICSQMSDFKHFDLYNSVDISLDTYPYNGTTTTCEAMWMGVPVVSLVGEHHMSRVGASLLSKLSLDYFAAKNADEYVNKSVALALNPDSLAKIREMMRVRMISSGLCDGLPFAREVEKAYEEMVEKWEQSHS